MNKFIAAIITLIIVAVVGYLLVVVPWVIGAVLIIVGLLVVVWIFIMALYTGLLSLLETLDLAINRRRARRRNGEG